MDEWISWWFAWPALILILCSWVNMAMIAAALGLLLPGKRADRTVGLVFVGTMLVLLFLQGDDLLFAGDSWSSLAGLGAAITFYSLILEREDNTLYNATRFVAFVLLLPTTVINVLILGFRFFLLFAKASY